MQYRKVHTHPTLILEQLQSGLNVDWGLDIYSPMWYSFGSADCVSFSGRTVKENKKREHAVHTWKKVYKKHYKEKLFLCHLSIVADNNIYVHCCHPAANVISTMHSNHLTYTLGYLRDSISESGTSKSQEVCEHSHIIIGIYWAGLFWLRAVQRHRQFFHNGSAIRGRPGLHEGAIRYESN